MSVFVTFSENACSGEAGTYESSQRKVTFESFVF